MAGARRGISPDQWVRYWRAGTVVGVVALVLGVVFRDAGTAVLGIVTIVLSLVLASFWRIRGQAQAGSRESGGSGGSGRSGPSTDGGDPPPRAEGDDAPDGDPASDPEDGPARA